MLIAIDKFGNEIDAKDAKRNEKYYCPVCNSEVNVVILKKSTFHTSAFICVSAIYITVNLNFI